MKNSLTLKSEFVRLNTSTRLYGIPVPIIGLTGGIATGKSTVCEILQKKGLHVISADSVAKKVYSLKSTIEYFQKTFPQFIKNDQIDFEAIKKVFWDEEKTKEKIETYIYSKMKDIFTQEYTLIRAPKLIIYEVALLFEKNLQQHVDLSICLYCSREEQIKRMQQRNNFNMDYINKILTHQIDIEKKRTLCDFVLENNSLTDLQENVEKLLKKILN